MDQQVSSSAQNRTSVERRGDRELVVTRTFDAPPSMVYRAWSQPELFRRWWMPKSASGVSIVSCDMDVRTGGKYRLEFSAGGPDTMAFYGKYLEVVPNERIVWTNDEGEEGAVTTVTFEDQGGNAGEFPRSLPVQRGARGGTAGLGGRIAGAAGTARRIAFQHERVARVGKRAPGERLLPGSDSTCLPGRSRGA